ncbi:MAG: TonB family protein [Gammaproteobacteria bacterium]
MTYDSRKTGNDDLPEEFGQTLESYILGAVSIEQIRRTIGALLSRNQDWGPEMLTAIDTAFQDGHLNGTAHRTLMTEIDLGTSEDEPTEWSEEIRAEAGSEPTTSNADAHTAAAASEHAANRPPLESQPTGLATDTDTNPPVLTQAVDSAEPQAEAPPERKPIGSGTLLQHRFLLKEKAGTGSMGDVYKALDREKEASGSPEPWVAVKIVSQKFSRNPNALEALKQEAAHGQRLVHPNIIRVFDFDWDGDLFFMTMEWLEGRSLVDILNGRRFQPLPFPQANSIIQGLCHGLAYAHKQGIVHADIKPGNIFITRAGHVKLLDFGIARATDGMPTDFDATGIGAHTPAYSSCEVLEGAPTAAVDDIYSLGCVAYRLLAGRRAFGGATALEAETNQTDLQRIPNLSDSQWNALQNALTLRRMHRTPDVATFVAEFSDQATVDMTRPLPAELRTQPPPEPIEPPADEHRGLPLKVAVPALAAVLTAIAAVLWWPMDSEVGPPVPAASLPQPTERNQETDTLRLMSEMQADAAADESNASTGVSSGEDISDAPVAESVTTESTDASAANTTMAETEAVADSDAREAAAAAAAVLATQAAGRDAASAAEPEKVATPQTPDTPAAQSVRATSTTDSDTFESLLDAANERMDEGRLLEPEEDSARHYLGELEAIASDSPELQQAKLRLANLMLLEAMVAITDERFNVAENWIATTRELQVPDAMIERYEQELQDARDAKATRASESLGAIFASATPAAILADPDVSFDTSTETRSMATVDADMVAQPTTLAMVLPGAAPTPEGATAALPTPEAEPDPGPVIMPISAFEFRRFVEPERPSGPFARNKEGWVEVRFRVNEKGKPIEIEISDSEPADVFDQAALSAIRKWRFEPYLVGGQPAVMSTGVRLRFQK